MKKINQSLVTWVTLNWSDDATERRHVHSPLLRACLELLVPTSGVPKGEERWVGRETRLEMSCLRGRSLNLVGLIVISERNVENKKGKQRIFGKVIFQDIKYS